MSLAEIAEFFDVFALSPEGWPVHCNLTTPNDAALARWPRWPSAALPSAGRAASGHGVTMQLAQISGLGEAVEVASLCRWGDEATVKAREKDLPGEVWSATTLAGFSRDQRSNREAWNAHLKGTDWIAPNPGTTETEWVQIVDLTGAPVWVPAQAVFLGEHRSGDPEAILVADTNGCAAGPSDSAAQAGALLELIERDATGRWWYGCRARHHLADTMLDDAGRHLIEACRTVGLATRLFDITSDIGVPVVAAVGQSAKAPPALGFAAAPTFQAAALKALAEMAQMALVFQGGVGEARPGLETWAREAGDHAPPLSLGAPPAAIPPNAPTSIGTRLQDAGIRVAFLCQTRPEFSVPVWRALSPDLCHWKPRFGRSRLLARDDRDLTTVSPAPNPVLLRI